MSYHEPQPEGERGGGIHCLVCRQSLTLIDARDSVWVHDETDTTKESDV